MGLLGALSILVVAILWNHIIPFLEHVTNHVFCFVPSWLSLQHKCTTNIGTIHSLRGTHPRFSHQKLVRKTDRPVSTRLN